MAPIAFFAALLYAIGVSSVTVPMVQGTYADTAILEEVESGDISLLTERDCGGFSIAIYSDDGCSTGKQFDAICLDGANPCYYLPISASSFRITSRNDVHTKGTIDMFENKWCALFVGWKNNQGNLQSTDNGCLKPGFSAGALKYSVQTAI